MSKSADLRWSFIRRVYLIIAMQLLLTFAFGAVIALCHPINTFLTTTRVESICCLLLAFIDPLIIAYQLYYYLQRRPVNYVLLAILTICVAFYVGLACTIASRKVMLEAVILTTIVVVSLTLFTFWAAKRGYEFDFFDHFLFGWFMVMLAFGYIQTFFPLGEISDMIHGRLSATLFCGYIVYDTEKLIKRYTHGDYIWAAVALYLDVIYIFKGLLIK